MHEMLRIYEWKMKEMLRTSAWYANNIFRVDIAVDDDEDGGWFSHGLVCRFQNIPCFQLNHMIVQLIYRQKKLYVQG